ncbi:hypothetical protein PIB30_098413 [Stylosanthes scabra]|uniref:Uncharacterized protein n=1 Tax=Stylosanthes scabra TaxID=79078 RepID=A0ABU6UVF8_9FABA|nr:hypothetical protein [Stylosanthes scabra]
MTNNSDAYKRMRARKRNQANRLAAAPGSKDDSKSSSSPVSRVPPPGSENQTASGPETQPATEGQEFKIPKTHATAADQSKSKKRKGFGHSYGSVYAPNFDVVGFTDKFIMENSRLALDEAGLKGNLEYMMRAGIKAAAISRALQKKLAECPPTSRAELEQLKKKILVPTLKVHLLHPDNYVAGSQIVWCSDLLPESGGPYFEEPAAEVGDAQKSEPQVGADDTEKTPSV